MLPQPQTLAELRGLLLQFAQRLTRSLLHPDSVALIRLVLGEAFRIPELRNTVRQALPLRALHAIAAIVGHADEVGLISAPDTDLTARDAARDDHDLRRPRRFPHHRAGRRRRRTRRWSGWSTTSSPWSR